MLSVCIIGAGTLARLAVIDILPGCFLPVTCGRNRIIQIQWYQYPIYPFYHFVLEYIFPSNYSGQVNSTHGTRICACPLMPLELIPTSTTLLPRILFQFTIPSSANFIASIPRRRLELASSSSIPASTSTAVFGRFLFRPSSSVQALHSFCEVKYPQRVQFDIVCSRIFLGVCFVFFGLPGAIEGKGAIEASRPDISAISAFSISSISPPDDRPVPPLLHPAPPPPLSTSTRDSWGDLAPDAWACESIILENASPDRTISRIADGRTFSSALISVLALPRKASGEYMHSVEK